MLKQKIQFKNYFKNGRQTAASLIVALVFTSASLYGGLVKADSYDDQIKALQGQNASSQAMSDQLAAQADNYQGAINALQNQINALEKSIADSQAKSADLQVQIDKAQADLNHNKDILAENIKAMYLEGDTTTLEMLASSKDLSDFVNKQQYRNVVASKVKNTLDTINVLKLQLEKQQKELEALIKQQQAQQTELASQQAQQNQLLAYTEGQKASYDSQIRAANSQIISLRAQQAAAIAALNGFGGSSAASSPVRFKNMTGPQWCGGGYEYCYAGLDDWVPDPFGFHLARECAHYAIDSLYVRGYDVGGPWPAGSGYANRWVGYTTSAGLATLVSSPQPDDVVFIPIPGSWIGHVAIVDYVNGDGTVHVSQMNWYPGMYNTMDLYLSSPGIQFLRFHR
jgi:peptidoglycan hydrolase CwlO-like protein